MGVADFDAGDISDCVVPGFRHDRSLREAVGCGQRAMGKNKKA
jgi:hypothetical protein